MTRVDAVESCPREQSKDERYLAGPYRDAEGFKEALKSLRSLCKGEDIRSEMHSAVQLITHLAWRSPDATVNWYASTLQEVRDYADLLAVGRGTVIREAVEVALRHAEAAAKGPQVEGLEVLAGIIRQHGTDPDSPRMNEGEGVVDGEDAPKPRGLHHRIYPCMDSVIQYATGDRGKDVKPWIVRDRSAALRAERRGEGRAMVRVWAPSPWAYVNDEPKAGNG